MFTEDQQIKTVTEGQDVIYERRYGSRMAARVVSAHRNHDGRLNGIVRIEITENGPDAGKVLDVGMVTLAAAQ